MMEYVDFVHVHEFFRYSFQDHCENRNHSDEEDKPLVCFIAIKNAFTSEVLSLFKKKIEELEQTVFDQKINNTKNLTSHIQKITFGFIDPSKNKQFLRQILNKIKLDKVKYLVYVSDSNLLGAFNNLDDFEDVFEDAKEGIFDEYLRIRDLHKKDEPVSKLLVNEYMTFMVILSNMLTWNNIGESFLILIVLFLVCYKGLKQT